VYLILGLTISIKFENIIINPVDFLNPFY